MRRSQHAQCPCHRDDIEPGACPHPYIRAVGRRATGWHPNPDMAGSDEHRSGPEWPGGRHGPPRPRPRRARAPAASCPRPAPDVTQTKSTRSPLSPSPARSGSTTTASGLVLSGRRAVTAAALAAPRPAAAGVLPRRSWRHPDCRRPPPPARCSSLLRQALVLLVALHAWSVLLGHDMPSSIGQSVMAIHYRILKASRATRKSARSSDTNRSQLCPLERSRLSSYSAAALAWLPGQDPSAVQGPRFVAHLRAENLFDCSLDPPCARHLSALMVDRF